MKCAGFDGAESIIRAYGNGYKLSFWYLWLEEKDLFLRKQILSLKINNKLEYDFETTTERKLFTMVVKAARDSEILQENEFSNYLKKTSNQTSFKSLQETLALSYAREHNLLTSDRGKGGTYRYNEMVKSLLKIW